MTPPSPQPFRKAGPYLALLIVINLFNYTDRQVLAAVLPDIQQDGSIFPPGDEAAEAKAGWLASAFLVSYMLFSPLFGWLDGHRYRRWVILGLGVSLWSLASGSTGLVQSYWLLLLLRCLIGVGEGAYGPVASAMIADMYSAERRGMPMALFNMAIPVGSALGYLLGAAVSGITGQWQPAFWVTFGGLALGALCFLQKEPPRPPAPTGPVPGYFRVLAGLVRNRSFALCCLGMTAITFVIGGVAFWSPTYLFQREARFAFTDAVFDKLAKPRPDGAGVPGDTVTKLHSLADGEQRVFTQVRAELRGRLSEKEGELFAEAIYKAAATDDSPRSGFLTIVFGGMIVLGGLAATWAGTWMAERLRPQVPGAYFWVTAAGAAFAVPFYLGFLFLPLPWGWPCVFLSVFGLFLHTGPAFTVLANVTRSDERATAFAINILVIHALGDVISPPLMGWVAGWASLQTAFLGLTLFILVGAVLWATGVKFLASDTARAEDVSPPAGSAAPPTP
jgi:hypothetical protein